MNDNASMASATQSGSDFLIASANVAKLWKRAATMTKPTMRVTPDEWARQNRSYPPSAGVPGPREPSLTPYMIAFSRAVAERLYKRVVQVMFAQGGKSDTILDIIGQRLDTAPVPSLYVGPTKQMVAEQFEPRIMQLLDEAPVLRKKVSRGKKMSKTRKFIAGVPLRLAHAGSSAALKSDPFGLALTDEADELMANVKGQGNPIEMIDARGTTYADFVHAIVSTPSTGPAETYACGESGLEFWDEIDQSEVASTIWRLWLSGTRHHWAVPCPHCREFFIPRFKCMRWQKPKAANGKELPSTPALARRTAYLECPRSGCVIEDEDSDKPWMNESGQYVAPGQSITPDGAISGLPPDATTISFWASGLMNPFKTWGDLAAEYVQAVRSGQIGSIQTVLNQGFGEVFVPGDGEVPDWHEVQLLGEVLDESYSLGDLPDGVLVKTLTADVQKMRIIYTIRGWGAGGTSWLLDAGELHGDTAEEDIWNDLANLVQPNDGEMPIRLALIDSGFRPGKKEAVPEHRVYEFCRRFPRLTRATKGASTVMRKPVIPTKVDLKVNGKATKHSLEILRLDTDHFKSLVHQKVRWPTDAAGAWYLPADISDDFCMQIVSEARVKTPGGKTKWVQRSKENHFLDCEAMQFAAAAVLNLRHLRPLARLPRCVLDGQPTRQRSAELGPD